MISYKTFFEKMKDVKFRDILSFGKFFLAIPIAQTKRKKRSNLWLVCEDGLRASDNGYAFFEYVRKEHPEQDIAFAIDSKSPEYKKVAKLGETVHTGSLQHWVYYLMAEHNISSQKSGKPNAAVCYFLEIGGFIKNSRIFLQHGITINDSKWIYYPQTKFEMFVCAAKPEYEFVLEKFQYPKDKVRYLGFPRYDRLHKVKKDPNLIVIMPTWRNWLKLASKNDTQNTIEQEVENSQYIKAWNDLLNDKRFISILEKYDMKALFYPHRNMQEYLNLFNSSNSRVVLADWKEYDIGDLIEKGSFLITDYSSVFFDFVYCKKPVAFYQFDVEKYREKQLQKGYFDYFNNPFGKCTTKLSELIEEVESIVSNGCDVSEKFLEGHKKYFPLYDDSNSFRVYKAIKSLTPGE